MVGLSTLKCIHSLHVTGEATSADIQAANIFPAELQRIIEEGGYSPKQVFNVDKNRAFLEKNAFSNLYFKE
jgi:hypothetical protein